MLVYIFPEDEYGSSPRSDGPIVTEYRPIAPRR